MFKRIIYDDLAGFVPEVSFWLTFSVFLIIAVRAILLRKREVQSLAEIPFQEEQPIDEKHPS